MWKSSAWNQQKVTRLQNVKSKLFSLITSYLHSSGWLAGPSEVIVKAFQPEGMCEFNIQVSSMIFRYIRHINKHLILNSTISVIYLQNLHKLQTKCVGQFARILICQAHYEYNNTIMRSKCCFKFIHFESQPLFTNFTFLHNSSPK